MWYIVVAAVFLIVGAIVGGLVVRNNTRSLDEIDSILRSIMAVGSEQYKELYAKLQKLYKK